MTCDDIRDRLFALPDPGRPTSDLRPHLAGCPACTALQAALAGVEADIGRLPVPSSADAKGAFLARVVEPDPIIARVPSQPRRGMFDAMKWQHVAGLAAGVLIAVGGWFVSRPGPEPQPVAMPRHELLHKEVRHVVKLTNAASAADRMTIWADVATDLRTEVGAVYQIAPDPDMTALADMFRKAVDDGVLAQARKLPEFLPARERHNKLAEASKKLADAEAEANRLLTAARPQAKPVLEQMARTAKAGKETLEKLARGEKA